jgi:quercetin dioxygenase-like cupin family protein
MVLARSFGTRTPNVAANIAAELAKRAASQTRAGDVSGHQPDQGEFRAILAEDIDWKPFSAFPPGARLAILVGHPDQPGPYVIRVKLPGGAKIMPHKHPEDCIYTVISGVFYIGLGEAFDEARLVAYPPGSVIVLPGDQIHFHWAKSGEYVTQITAIGPLGLAYVDEREDPRANHESPLSSPPPR